MFLLRVDCRRSSKRFYPSTYTVTFGTRRPVAVSSRTRARVTCCSDRWTDAAARRRTPPGVATAAGCRELLSSCRAPLHRPATRSRTPPRHSRRLVMPCDTLSIASLLRLVMTVRRGCTCRTKYDTTAFSNRT